MKEESLEKIEEERIEEKAEEDKIEEILFTPIKEPHSYVRVIFDKESNEYLYEVIEPVLTPEEKEILDFIKDTLIRTLEYGMKDAEEKEKEEFLRKSVKTILHNRSIKLDEKSEERIMYYILRDFIGYGKIDAMMIDPLIEDISCDGPGVPLYIFHREYESMRTNVKFDDEEELDSFVIGLVQRCGKHISIAEPMVDATIPDGSRLQATLAKEVTTRGSSFTVRRFREEPMSAIDLVKLNTINAEIAAYLWLAVENGESMLISGGTASGKTTTMNAILLFVPPQMKIISIEDTREINLPHENWIADVTRSGFGSRIEGGKTFGEIDMFELMKTALRQRPQYLVVGEVRGIEASILFQAMATGHTTYSTIHADSIHSIVQRLENPPINLPRVLLSALNTIVLQTNVRVRDRMVRRVQKIVEIVGLDPNTNEIITNTVYDWNIASDSFFYQGTSYLFDKIQRKKNLTRDEMKEEFKRRIEIINWMVKNDIRDFRGVARVIAGYYKQPGKVLEKIRSEMDDGKE